MTDTEITALAREYAEECCPIEAYEKAELIDPYKEEVFERKADILATQIEFEQFLEWLTRRYCLVEKSKLEDVYQRAKNTEKDGEDLKLPLLCRTGRLQRILLESLFPEIANEIE